MKAQVWKLVIVTGSLLGASLFAAAFHLVVVRSEISADASRIAALEYRILKAQDVLRGLEVTVDDSVQPHVLKARVNGMLELPYEGQVVRVKKEDLEGLNSERQFASSVTVVGKEGV